MLQNGNQVSACLKGGPREKMPVEKGVSTPAWQQEKVSTFNAIRILYFTSECKSS